LDSQPTTPDPQLLKLHTTLTIDTQALQADIQSATEKDPTYARFLKTGEELDGSHWSRKRNRLILHENRVFVPDSGDLRLHALRSKHDHKLAGHPRQSKTYQLVCRDYSWPNLKEFVADYVRTCNTCSRNKARRHKPYGLLKQLPIPSQPWESISMDFIEQLPESEGYTEILVIIDRLTKQAIFIPTQRSIDVAGLTEIFIREVFSKHGTPNHITSDRGSEFVSKFFRSLASALDIKLHFTSGYHPEADGQTKRTNQMLEQYLRIFCTYQQSDWAKLLPLAEFAFNSAPSATTNISPFFTNKGYHPKLEIQTDRESWSDAARPYLANLEATHTKLRQTIANAQARYQKWGDNHRLSAPEIKIGDNVFVLAKFIKTTRPSKKLSERYLGPFEVIGDPGTHSYLIKLPKHLRSIHPICHKPPLWLSPFLLFFSLYFLFYL